MRTTVNLDDDVLAVAKAAAEAEGVSLGAIVSRLMRQSINGQARIGVATRRPMFQVSPGSPPITPESIRAVLDDDA